MTRRFLHRTVLVLFGTISIFGLAGCNLPTNADTPTPEADITQAYQTVQARLTEVIALTISPTSPDATDNGVVTQTPTATPPTTTPRPSPTSFNPPVSTALCDQAAAGNPIDVTIPDDTVMLPNQAFTKVWRLQNTGKCTWNRNYAIAYFSGEKMSAPVSVPLTGDIAPGQSVDIQVDMIAPSTPGTFQGNWKLRNASSVLFGIGPNGSAPFWVRVIVVVTPTPTPTRTATLPATSPAPQVTPTATPVIKASGTLELAVNDSVDLDTAQITSSGGIDMLYEVNGASQHLLTPKSNAIMGVYGNTQPSRLNCLSAPMTSSAIVLENTPVVSYLCYRTDQGAPGFARLTSYNASTQIVGMDVLTWDPP